MISKDSITSRYLILADDDKDDCIIFKEALREIDAPVHLHYAEHGAALLKILQEATILPDIIFMDINMPIKNGKECLQEIKSKAELSSIPIIIYSTSTNQRDVDETYKAGANLYLEKPYSFTDLIQVLGKLLHLDWSEYIPQPSKDKFVWHSN